MNLLFGDLPRRRGTEALQRDAQRALAVVVVAGLTFIAILGILILIDSS